MTLVLISGCAKDITYSQPNIQNPQPQMIGGGCSVAGIEDNKDTKQLPMIIQL